MLLALFAHGQDTVTPVADPTAVADPTVAPVTTIDSTPDAPEEESNPNCTTGNANACNNANGFWDFRECTCTFPPAHVSNDDNDNTNKDVVDEDEEGFEFDEDDEGYWEDDEKEWTEEDEYEYERFIDLMEQYPELQEKNRKFGWQLFGQ
jgi:hypothetical protein